MLRQLRDNIVGHRRSTTERDAEKHRNNKCQGCAWLRQDAAATFLVARSVSSFRISFNILGSRDNCTSAASTLRIRVAGVERSEPYAKSWGLTSFDPSHPTATVGMAYFAATAGSNTQSSKMAAPFCQMHWMWLVKITRTLTVSGPGRESQT